MQCNECCLEAENAALKAELADVRSKRENEASLWVDLNREADERESALKAERDKLHAALASSVILDGRDDDLGGPVLVVDLKGIALDGASIAAALVRLHERATREEG